MALEVLVPRSASQIIGVLAVDTRDGYGCSLPAGAYRIQAINQAATWYWSDTDGEAPGDMTEVSPGDEVSFTGPQASLYFKGDFPITLQVTFDPPLAAIPPDGGFPGAKTIVVGKGGNDTDGAASPYTDEFLTIEAALTAAVSGDVVIVRPGTYTPAAAGIDLKIGVRLHGLPGAKIAKSGNGNYCLGDAAGAVNDCPVTGSFQIVSTGGANGIVQANGSDFLIDCESISVGGAGSPVVVTGAAVRVRVRARDYIEAGAYTVVSMDAGGEVTVEADRIFGGASTMFVFSGGSILNIFARRIEGGAGRTLAATANGRVNIEATERINCGTTSNGHFFFDASSICTIRAPYIYVAGTLVKINSSDPTIDIVCTKSIEADLIVDSQVNGTAEQVSIRAPRITADAGLGANAGIHLDKVGGACRYDIACDVLMATVWASAIGGSFHLCAETHVGTANDYNTFGAYLMECFLRYGEARGSDVAMVGAPIWVGGNGTKVHIMSGRIIGSDVDSSGNAVEADDAPAVQLYPGVVLIAGADAGTTSIGASATPTVVAMGVIAANKAAAVGVVVAVGALLVDAAVV